MAWNDSTLSEPYGCAESCSLSAEVIFGSGEYMNTFSLSTFAARHSQISPHICAITTYEKRPWSRPSIPPHLSRTWSVSILLSQRRTGHQYQTTCWEPRGLTFTSHSQRDEQLLAAPPRTNFLALSSPLAIQIKAGYKLSVTFHKVLQHGAEMNSSF